MRHAPTLALPLLLMGCSEQPPTTEPVTQAPTPPEPEPVLCDCTLGSWIVAARGRHLHLDIDCPEAFDHLDGRIEFTTAALRSDFDPRLLAERDLPNLVRMTPGSRLSSPTDDPRPRTEAEYTIDVTTAAWMQRDIAFDADYVLLGSNSNSAMRALLEHAGLEVPSSILASGGFFGEFPGINFRPGTELTPDRWPDAGLERGPRPVPTPLPDAWDELGTISAPADATPASGTPAP